MLLLAVAGLAIATPALAATNATNAAHHDPRRPTRPGPRPAGHAAASPARLTANLTPARPRPGGVCQVPGIGDIGGLVGL